MLASVEVNLIFLEHIKVKQFEEKRLNALINKVVCGEVEDATLDTNGVLWFKETLCDPRVGDFIFNVLSKTHGLCYSIHSRTTKIYRDMR